MEDVINHGDAGNKLYVILKGVVSVHTPNPAIKERKLFWREYMILKKWKETELDPKIEIARREQEDGYMKETAAK